MEIKARFDHFNINVTDLERSLAFYDRALGLKEISRKHAERERGGRDLSVKDLPDTEKES